jgi:hypothetical protein
MTLHQTTADAYFNNAAALRSEATQLRALWATVVLQAMNASARAIRSYKEEGRDSVADSELRSFSAWIESKDGKDCLSLAGVDPSSRAIKSIIDAVVSGRAISTIEKGRLDVQERQH